MHARPRGRARGDFEYLQKHERAERSGAKRVSAAKFSQSPKGSTAPIGRNSAVLRFLHFVGSRDFSLACQGTSDRHCGYYARNVIFLQSRLGRTPLLADLHPSNKPACARVCSAANLSACHLVQNDPWQPLQFARRPVQKPAHEIPIDLSATPARCFPFHFHLPWYVRPLRHSTILRSAR